MRNYIIPILILLWALWGSWYWVTFQKSEAVCCQQPEIDTVYIVKTIKIIKKIEIIRNRVDTVEILLPCNDSVSEFYFEEGVPDLDLTNVSNYIYMNKIKSKINTFNGNIHIIGHANNNGPHDYNNKLTINRANSVAHHIEAYLKSLDNHKIKRVIVTMEGKGKREQKHSGKKGIILNRRVEIKFENNK